MRLLVISFLAIISIQQYCETDDECDSLCNQIAHVCELKICSDSSNCFNKCCIDGKCKAQKYCHQCSSHEECDSKCCLQGNCYAENQCPYFPIGMACSFDYQCASYQCVSNYCVDVVDTACSNHTDCTTKCCYNGKCQLDQKALCPDLQINMTCSHNWECDTYLCEASRCKALLTGRCYSHEDCQSGCCKNSRCAALNQCSMKTAQSACAIDYECITNRCSNSKCISRTGEACSNHTECEYQCCLEGVCGFGCNYLKIGAGCLTHGDCVSYICRSGICVGEIGSRCAHHNQCKSGFCMNLFCSNNYLYQKNKTSGSSCVNNYECSNYFCINNTCVVLSGMACLINSDCSSLCCVDSMCTFDNVTFCSSFSYDPIYYDKCSLNSHCDSGICSDYTCLAQIGGHPTTDDGCVSMCYLNYVCAASNLCVHKNAGEKCSSNFECINGNCNGVCLGKVASICANRYGCIVDSTKSGDYGTHNISCPNHICTELPSNNELCEVDEDCLYQYDYYKGIYYFKCMHGKCLAINGTVYNDENCHSRCSNVVGSGPFASTLCVIYSYCSHKEGQLCQSHKDCNSKCCYKNNTMLQSKCSSLCLSNANTQSCSTHYDCSSFYCNPSTKICQNMPCNYHQECMNNCCINGVCATTCSLLPVLSSCSNNYQCASNLCLSEKCKLLLWEPCLNFDECQTGCCNNGVCKTNTTENCPFKNPMEQCSKNHECKSNDCSSTLLICKATIGESCSDHKYCVSGCCGSNLKCYDALDSANCKLFGINHICSSNYECLSYNCYSLKCKANINESCGNHNECSSNYCNENSKCAELNSVLLIGGDSCTGKFQCESYTCQNNTCKALDNYACKHHLHCLSKCCGNDELCHTNSDPICKSLPAPYSCIANYECESYVCYNGYCKSSIDWQCYNHSQCVSGYCIIDIYSRKVCAQLNVTLLKVGEQCANDYNCESFKCSSYCPNYNLCHPWPICKAPINASCTLHGYCDSGCCGRNGTCLENELMPSVYDECIQKQLEQACSDNYECTSTLCDNGYCKVIKGFTCTNHKMCVTQYCNGTVCTDLTIVLKKKQEICTTNSQCESFDCMLGICKGSIGESCTFHSQCHSACCGSDSNCQDYFNCPQKRTSEACTANYQCFSSLCSQGYCKGDIQDSCSSHTQCYSGYCNYYLQCAALTFTLLKSGEKCVNRSQCETFFCYNYTCQKANGEVCTRHMECVSGICGNGTCSTCDFFYNIYEDCNLKTITMQCLHNYECRSYLCVSGVCRVNLGDDCNYHSYCYSGYCNENQSCDVLTFTFSKAGDACSKNSECDSYYCSGTICKGATGATCAHHNHCQSYCCGADNKCLDTCSKYSTGHACIANFQCQNYACISEICKCNLNEECNQHSDCISGYCNDKTMLCAELTFTLIKGGEPCIKNSQCESYSCIEKICKVQIGGKCLNHNYCNSSCCASNEKCISSCTKYITGHNCSSNYQCQSFICSYEICKVNITEACSSHKDCLTNYCSDKMKCEELTFALLQGGGVCIKSSQCESYNCTEGTCKAQIGYSCLAHTHCASGCCGKNGFCYDNTNTENCYLYPVNSQCTAHFQCKTYICSTGYCKSKIGENCTKHKECSSGYCDDKGKCDILITSPFKDGNICSTNAQCESYSCNRVCLAENNQPCINHAGCISGCCKNEICDLITQCPMKNNGNSCFENYECKSFNCSNLKCNEYQAPPCHSHITCKEGFCCSADNLCYETKSFPKCGKNVKMSCEENYECMNYKCTNNFCDNLYCTQHADCISNCCYAGICLDKDICPLFELGAYCTNNYECKSYQCAGFKCVDYINKPCSNHADCPTECCFNGTCQYNSLSKCPNHELMEPCYLSSDCKNYECKDSLCLSKLNDRCFSHLECGSGCCFNSSCKVHTQCTFTAIGLPCNRHYECNSYLCKKSKCVGINGDVCRNHHECESGCCRSGVCDIYCYHYRLSFRCQENWECESYICKSHICVGDIGSVCIYHDSCDSGCCHGVCTSMPSDYCQLKSSGSTCVENSNCKDFICKSGTCLEVTGKQCSNHTVCKSNCCVGLHCADEETLCTAKNTYEDCQWNHECRSMICGSEKKCIGIDGNKCLGHVECFSGCCSQGICSELNEMACPMKLIGKSCNSSSECLSFKCVSDICTGFDGDICKNHTWCVSGCCKGGNCKSNDQCNALKFGSPCQQDDDCLSYNCLDSYCVGENGITCSDHMYCKSKCCLYSVCSTFESCRAINSGGWCKTDFDCKSFNCLLNLYRTEGICYSDIGMNCNNHTECLDKCCFKDEASARCDKSATCLNKVVNDKCLYDNDCSNFYCNENTQKCANFIGKSCTNHQSCYFGCCYEEKCSKDMCPQLAPISPCESNYMCASYLCIDGKCKVPLLESCISHEGCESGCCSKNICKENNTLNCLFLNNFEHCKEDSDCKSTSCSQLLGICIANIFEDCISHRHCISGCCSKDGKCHLTSDHESCPLFIGGKNCSADYQCNSNFCIDQKCQSYFGDECRNHSECYKGYCLNKICTILDTTLKRIGESCILNSECESMLCINDICKNNKDEYCMDHKSCQSGCCYSGEICKPIEMCYNRLSGFPCKANYECLSFNCENGYCDGKEGTACKSHNNCKIGECCVDDYCYASDLYPSCGAKINGTCSQNSDCSSYVCRENKCVGLKCKRHENCASRCCGENSYCGTKDCSPKYAGKHGCVSNYECESYLCVKGECKEKSGMEKRIYIWMPLLMMVLLW